MIPNDCDAAKNGKRKFSMRKKKKKGKMISFFLYLDVLTFDFNHLEKLFSFFQLDYDSFRVIFMFKVKIGTAIGDD